MGDFHPFRVGDIKIPMDFTFFGIFAGKVTRLTLSKMTNEKKYFKTLFEFNHVALNKNLDDVSHQNSLIVPAGNGSCINWIMGHILVSRDLILQILQLPKCSNDDMKKLYSPGTHNPPAGAAHRIEVLRKIYNDSHARIMEVLPGRKVPYSEEKTKNPAAMLFHEAYHIGQIGSVRRMIGMPAAIQ